MEDAQINELQTLLSKLEPGYLPQPIFLELARLSVTAILELVPLRKNRDNKIEVLVVKRPDNDPHWAGQFHTPGTVLLPTDDNDFQSALERVFREIDRDKGNYKLEKGESIFHSVRRGKELAVICTTIIDDEKETDVWLCIDELEGKVVDTQFSFIQMAAETFSF